MQALKLKGSIFCSNDPSYSIPSGSELSLKIVDARLMDVAHTVLHEYKTQISGSLPQNVEFTCPPPNWDFEPSLCIRIENNGSLVCINDTHIEAPRKDLREGKLPSMPVIKIK